MTSDEMTDSQRLKEMHDAYLSREVRKDKATRVAVVVILFIVGMCAWYYSDTHVDTSPSRECIQAPTSAGC
jgi:hypothetical protein